MNNIDNDVFTDIRICFQTLKAEFDHHDNLLKELETQVDNYNEKGNSEAASRLQQQISLLKVRHTVYLLRSSNCFKKNCGNKSPFCGTLCFGPRLALPMGFKARVDPSSPALACT